VTSFATPLVEIVGGRTAKVLAEELELHTVGDLLRHYPRRYEEVGKMTQIRELQVGDHVTVRADVTSVSSRRMRNRNGSIVEVIVSDGKDRLHLTFFNMAFLVKVLKVGQRGRFSGKVSEYNGKRQLTSPSVHISGTAGDENAVLDDADDEIFTSGLIPIYPATKKAHNSMITRSVGLALEAVEELPDPVPTHLLRARSLVAYDEAVRHVHRAPDARSRDRAIERLRWDEAFSIQLTLAQRRARYAQNPARPRPRISGGLAELFDERLPFTLTDGQREVGDTLESELASKHPMHRLLQGEVGSGKTIVALRAMLQVVDSGGQAALLAPTEVLAVQHARTIELMLGELGQAGRFGASAKATRVTLLTGSLTAKARRQALLGAASGAAGIVVGTHALIQLEVQFADLGLVVVDEQHRFGVQQRDALRGKSLDPPHLLVMTATPIPRTVAMTVFGDLDISELHELPTGRSPIATSVVPIRAKPSWLDRAWARVVEEVQVGHQAFVVCPRIGEDPTQDSGAEPDIEPEFEDEGDEEEARRAAAVLEVAPLLAEGPLKSVRVGVLHGRMATDDKDRVMTAFQAGEIDVLVATTVIEVGVDVPNATVMVVLDADRFGISQLHQLRGRIGRGSAKGLCLLVTESDAPASRSRLEAVEKTLNGFELAEHDLDQRREGDVLGVAQSGRHGLAFLSLRRDREVIVDARDVANAIVANDPDLRTWPELAELAASLVRDRAEFLEKA
jgi:ATP-dependent DNA helicase RecG